MAKAKKPSPATERKAFEERHRNLVPRVWERAMNLLLDRRRWTAHTLARDAQGHHISPTDSRAQQWCAVGAIERCAFEVVVEECGNAMNTTFLAQLAAKEIRPYIMQAAKDAAPQMDASEIPQVNDHARNGGYLAIINGFSLATGRIIDLTPAQREALAEAEKRSAAARKGWFTRRLRLTVKLHQERMDAVVADIQQAAEAERAEQAVLVFGGTITPAPEPSKKEVTV